jgi:hypothetical protein
VDVAVTGDPKTLREFRSLVQAELRRIGRGLRRADDDWPLLRLYVQSPRGIDEADLSGVPLELGRQKRIVVAAMKAAISLWGAYRYVLVVNVHSRELDEEQRARVNMDEIRIEDLPGAREYLWITAGDAESEEFLTARIRRDPGGRRPPTLGAWHDPVAEGGELGGRMLGLNEALRRRSTPQAKEN